ncbi:SMP-30/gluconolactonase/LRE family protein [Dyadobacter sediminis]|uniref:SMP-30/gluconolactonase/LRE family protein n=1 Tax=Dyadobacter sediminis TaxID=1493691 RepID=A0A5R9KA96_9BACT|nr:SMP-30/gluconolactonase/LRE family protein [Dyadobacter sediminis]TLU91726.1 SMP-30/gluconolactonase/LRE family protein [Dyadobacter sediminis]GGC00829.1 gluconolactonase [Dyadobacter sediminis]
MNKLIASVFYSILLLLAQPSFAQTKSKNFSNEGEFTSNCEGPAVDQDGNVYAVNFARDGTIAQINKKGNASFFVTLPKGSTGNGIRFGDANTFYVADFTGHNVLKVNLITKETTVFANEPKMNQPNDLAITASGHIFCSDPNWKENTGQIWHVSPDGKTKIAAENMGTTNGIDISPDEKKLYVNESVQKNVWVFDLSEDGTLSNKKLLYHFEDGGMDGMRCDILGNLYIARHGVGEVAVLSPEGKVIQTIKTIGKKVSNICFGGRNGKTCYITLQDRGCLESFQAKSAGREWAMMEAFSEKK